MTLQSRIVANWTRFLCTLLRSMPATGEALSLAMLGRICEAGRIELLFPRVHAIQHRLVQHELPTIEREARAFFGKEIKFIPSMLLR